MIYMSTKSEKKVAPKKEVEKKEVAKKVTKKAPAKKTAKTEIPKGSVQLFTFTGMDLGIYPITEETKATIKITLNSGNVLEFSKKTMKQKNAKNEKFANKIAI